MLTNRHLPLLVTFIVTFCGHLATTVLSVSNASQPISFQMVEKSPAATFIGNVFADSGLDAAYTNPADRANLRLSFRTPGPSYLTYFTLNETTGILRTSTNLLDRDRICAYQNSCLLAVEVQVLPVNYFQLFTISINVIDINDHAPSFTPNFVRLNISESEVPGRVYPLPPVDDPDGGGSNGIQSFRLEPNSTKFQLSVGFLADGSADVQLRLMEYLDRSRTGFYSLTVIAVDGGTPPRSGSLAVNVTVIDSVNLAQSLVFENTTYEVTVSESLSTGSVILRVKASYQGASASSPNAGQILYGIESGAQRSQVFGINSQSGDIYLNASLDFRTSSVLLLTVSATDRTRSTSLAAYARVTVKVTDANNNAPAIKVTTFTADGIAEVNGSAPVGSFVAYLGLSDADDGINAEVSCVINSTTFRLDPIYKDYILNTAVNFARGHPTQYAVAVNCTDRGSPSMSTVVIVSIRVSSPGPVFSTDRIVVDFYEHNSIGDSLVALNVTYDPPPDSKQMLFDHSSLEGSPLDAISVNSTSGVVTANVIFSYDVRPNFLYVVTVSASSRSQPPPPPSTASATLVINILRRPIPTTGALIAAGSGSPSSLAPASETPAATPTIGQDAAGPSLLKDSGSVIITAVVCATVIVVVIIVVVAVTVVCCRRNQQKAALAAAAAAAARLATKEDSMSSDGTKRLVRSLSSVSSSIASTSGDSRRELRLGSIQEESFEDTFHQMESGEWPTMDGQTSYPDCGLVGASSSLPADQQQQIIPMTKKGNLYVRSVSHPDNNQMSRTAGRGTSRSYGSGSGGGRSTPEDGSDTSRVTDLESDSYYSGSVADSGRGNSLQEDAAMAASAAAGQLSVSPRGNPPQQVFRTESDCSGSSERPLVAAPTTTRYPIENKIYITNHFRDALPRHPPRMVRAATKRDLTTAVDAGAREDPGGGGGDSDVSLTNRKLECNRSEYFDARSRASHHVPGHDRMRSPNGVASRSPNRETSPSSAPKGRKSRVGEFTRSLDATGHEVCKNQSPTRFCKNHSPTRHDVCKNHSPTRRDVCKNHSPTRHVSPSGDLRRPHNADYENNLGDTFV